MEIYPIKVGQGKEVHAGTADEVKKGRHTFKVYHQLCGSGKSSLAHSYHNPSLRLAYGQEITCKKCLAIIKEN